MLINLDIQIPNTSFDLLQVVAKKDQSFYARSQEQLRKKKIYIFLRRICIPAKEVSHIIVWFGFLFLNHFKDSTQW